MGIYITIRTDEKAGHIPHLHAKYNEYEVSVKTNGKILIGKFPHKKAKLLKKCILSEEGQRKIKENRNELNQNGIIVFPGPSKGLMQKNKKTLSFYELGVFLWGKNMKNPFLI